MDLATFFTPSCLVCVCVAVFQSVYKEAKQVVAAKAKVH